MSAYLVEQDHPTVVTVRMDGISAGWERWAFLRSDAHHDNPHCDQELEREHLEEAKRRNALIFDMGDAYCGMQGKYDKRADPRQLNPALRETGKPYLDAMVEYNAKFYEPYAKHWILLAPGNHETAIWKRHETNLTERLAERLRARGSPVRLGTYAGWVRFMFTSNRTRRETILMRYTHGYAGGGQVTRDVIQTNRQMVYIGDADILVSGHVHENWHVTIPRETLDHNGIPQIKDVECLKCPGYKDEYSCGEGWAVERGMAPKPKGGWWVRFYFRGSGVHFEVMRAK